MDSDRIASHELLGHAHRPRDKQQRTFGIELGGDGVKVVEAVLGDHDLLLQTVLDLHDLAIEVLQDVIASVELRALALDRVVFVVLLVAPVSSERAGDAVDDERDPAAYAVKQIRKVDARQDERAGIAGARQNRGDDPLPHAETDGDDDHVQQAQVAEILGKARQTASDRERKEVLQQRPRHRMVLQALPPSRGRLFLARAERDVARCAQLFRSFLVKGVNRPPSAKRAVLFGRGLGASAGEVGKGDGIEIEIDPGRRGGRLDDGLRRHRTAGKNGMRAGRTEVRKPQKGIGQIGRGDEVDLRVGAVRKGGHTARCEVVHDPPDKGGSQIGRPEQVPETQREELEIVSGAKRLRHAFASAQLLKSCLKDPAVGNPLAGKQADGARLRRQRHFERLANQVQQAPGRLRLRMDPFTPRRSENNDAIDGVAAERLSQRAAGDRPVGAEHAPVDFACPQRTGRLRRQPGDPASFSVYAACDGGASHVEVADKQHSHYNEPFDGLNFFRLYVIRLLRGKASTQLNIAIHKDIDGVTHRPNVDGGGRFERLGMITAAGCVSRSQSWR